MSQLPDRLVIASRGSKLALRQANTVAALVTARYPDLDLEIREVSTKGDRDKETPFTELTGKGLFTSEVEREVAEGRADVAVHSAKDLTAEIAPGCSIICVPERVAPHDVVVGGGSGSGIDRLGALPSGATIGTSSMRRRALLLELRPDLKVVEFRGNIDTRLDKVARGEVDAAILAAAGVRRLGRDDVDPGPLDPERWVPAPAQGALAVEALTERADLRELFEPLDDPVARAQVEAERAFGARLEGGCSIPLGCLAFADGPGLIVTGYLGHPDGSQSIRDRISGGMNEAAALGRELAEAILSSGGDELLEDVRSLDAPEVAEP